MNNKSKYKEVPEDIQQALKTIVEHFEKEDIATRQRQIRLWKKQEYFWAGYQRIFWDDTARDYRVWNDDVNDSLSLNEAAYYDKLFNIYRAYGESIIAALSAIVPGVTCIPDDADNPLDVSTAKGGNKIGELVSKHNDAPLLWCRALYILWTQGMIAAYNYPEQKKEYGLIDVDEYEDATEEQDIQVCPLCKMELEAPELDIENELHNQDADEYKPDDEDVLRNNLEQQGTLCLNCQQLVNPEIEKKTLIVTRLVGRTQNAKTRQRIDVNGGLYVRVANYARRQDETPYLSYCYETHFTNVLAKYKFLRDRLTTDNAPNSSAGSGYDAYERWGRLNTQYLGNYPENTPTVRNWWLRPETFEYEQNEDLREKLYKLFPNGAKVVLVNELFAEACNQDLDDCWTLTYNPLSEYLTFDPLGELAVSAQDITSNLINLTLQTIEHGIPQTFADPSVLNFEQYKKIEATPGQVIPAKAKTGSDLGKGFHTIQTASLGREVEPFFDRTQELGQFATGALPSLFGGAMPSSARTASQYSMSKNQAMQRLQTTWKMVNFWWKNVYGKVIPAYIKTMLEDERIVKKSNNKFINDTIKVAELQGKIGDIELESSEELPQTWSQVRDVLMQLMETQNPQIMEALGAPENLEVLRQALGLNSFKLPGEVSRQKQEMEIQALMVSQPMPGPAGQLEPSIMPELFVDDHGIEIDVCQYWLRSEAGQLAKIENKIGYDNVVAHLDVHMKMHQMIQANSMAPEQPVNSNESPVMDNA